LQDTLNTLYEYNGILNSLYIKTQRKLKLSKSRVNKQRISIAIINYGSECYDNIIYRSDYVMPALVNYTPRFWTCLSRLLLTRLSLFSRCPFSYSNPFFTGSFSLSLAFFLSPFNKLLARLSGFIVFPLDAALFIPHSPRIRKGCAGALRYIFGYILREEKREKERCAQKSNEKKDDDTKRWEKWQSQRMAMKGTR